MKLPLRRPPGGISFPPAGPHHQGEQRNQFWGSAVGSGSDGLAPCTQASGKAMSRRALLAGLASSPVAVTAPRPASDDPPPPFYSNVSQFISLRPPVPAPDQPIRTVGGSLIDFPALIGRVVIVNFWATWCAPCVAEMASLDRLAAQRQATRVTVLAIAMDRAGKPAVTAFYQRFGLRHLGIYVDPAQQVGHFSNSTPWQLLFPLRALPTTFLIDPRGVVVGYVPGVARWDSPKARKLIAWVATH